MVSDRRSRSFSVWALMRAGMKQRSMMRLMTDLLHFILLALALLAAPGPTNALLATAGATQTFRKALPLLAAELVGYAAALLVLIVAIGPVIAGHPAFAWTLRIAATLYLLYLAWRLWGHRLDEYIAQPDVRFRQLLIATLLNPKSLVVAFVLLPMPQPPLLHLVALAVLIVLTGGSWILLGQQVRVRAGEDVRLSTLRRTGAVVIALFALLLPASALWSAG
jgi:threonine/homoserine/homoserine lactone efflux protein